MSKDTRRNFLALMLGLLILLGFMTTWLWPTSDAWASPGQSGPNQTIPPALTPQAWIPLIVK